MLHNTGEAGRLACLAAHVWGEVRHAQIDPPVAAAVAALRASEGRIPLEQLAGVAGLPPRTLQRRFASLVGISPRTLAAVIRVRRLFDALERAETWSAAAQEAGYFDHPQMVREFRRFIGCTPSEFAAGRPGLAASLVANLQDARTAAS
ncbi:MAG: helix-turn-helix transcriptional regulator [Phenylobacterium sp.]|uniref:helix-turn-helix transcriptional regulator n=1 Tax=Phenylobacterium sp. TaxID=1871053 RepID=UPI0039192CFD